MNILWDGDYSFFSYKYNIEGYNGQDYDGPIRYIFMAFAIVSIVLLCIFLRKMKHEKIDIFLKVLSVFMPALEIWKVTWESFWDIKTGRGFNFEGLLPIYTCSLFMYVLLVAAWSSGKIKKMCLDWLSTIGFVAGMSNILFPRGIAWYPFLTFGALYSLLFHYIVVFVAVFLVATGYNKFEPKDSLLGMIPHMIFSAMVIPIDYIFGWDYMQYYTAGGVPLIEDLSNTFAKINMRWLTCPLMIAIYFLFSVLFTMIYYLIDKLMCRRKKHE